MQSFRPPDQSAAPVVRPRLLHRLDQARTFPVTLVIAPAGYGKSTLVAQWTAQVTHSVAWVSLSRAINGTAALLAAISRAVAAPRSLTTIDDLVSLLRSHVRDGIHMTLVVDDYHVIENRGVHEAMDGLLAYLPENVHLIITSRTLPPLSLARLRAGGKIAELADQDLRFTEDELTQVIDQLSPVKLTSEQAHDLFHRTEGWIAGTRLVLTALQQVDPTQVQSVLDTWTAHRWLDDYIVKEVLNRQSDNVRNFVLQTASLEWLTSELCDAVLEIDTSASLLEQVSQRLAFVRPHGTVSDGLAYHALFAESARRIATVTFSRSTIQQIRRRAAQWFEAHGEHEAAIDHAVAVADWETAIRCVRVIGRSLMDGDNHHSRLYWLERLPEPMILADPHLARWYLSALLYTGQHRRALKAGKVVTTRWAASDDPVQLGYLASFRAFADVVNGQADTMLARAYEALHHYPLECHVERMHAWSAVNGYEFALGNDEVAEQAHRQASVCRQSLPPEQWWWALQVEPDRANQRALRGELNVAESLYQLVLTRLPAAYRSHEAKIRYRLAAIYLEWNDLDRARDQLVHIERDLASFPRLVWHPEALLVVARVYAALGDRAARDDAMKRAQAICEEDGGQKGSDLLATLQAAFWLEDGTIGLAQDWARTGHHLHHTHLITFGDPDPQLLLARLDIATGKTDAAASRLQSLIDRAQATKRWAERIPLLVWQAVAKHELGDEAGSLASLQVAIVEGARGGFDRSFLTPGFDLTPIVSRVRPLLNADEIAWLDRLPAMSTRTDTIRANHDHSVVPHEGILTRRELDVLALIEQGYSNIEIAERLYFSLSSAKKHVSSILRKLGVPNRTAAVHWFRKTIGSGSDYDPVS